MKLDMVWLVECAYACLHIDAVVVGAGVRRSVLISLYCRAGVTDMGALVGTRLREGGHCACASFASSTTEITRSSCGRVELTCVAVQHWWSVLLTGAQAHACKQRLAWETPRGGTSLILSSVSFLSCWILEALGGVFGSWWRSLFGDRRLLAYSVMTVVACWTGCVDGRRTWSHLRSSATWKDGLSGGGKRGAGEGHLKREIR